MPIDSMSKYEAGLEKDGWEKVGEMEKILSRPRARLTEGMSDVEKARVRRTRLAGVNWDVHGPCTLEVQRWKHDGNLQVAVDPTSADQESFERVLDRLAERLREFQAEHSDAAVSVVFPGGGNLRLTPRFRDAMGSMATDILITEPSTGHATAVPWD
jgi:hypothetical protein